MVHLVNKNKSDTDSINYIITFLRVNKMVVNKDFLMSRNVSYIETIPIFPEEYIHESNNLTQ